MSRGDAGVGHQHLDRAVGLLDLRERGLDGGRVGDVAAHVERALGRTAAAGGDGDLVALGEEGLGDGAADAAVAAGDQDGTGSDACLTHAASTLVITAGYAKSPRGSLVLEPEADLHADLEVLDLRRPWPGRGSG